MKNLTNQRTDVEEGTPVIDDGLPPLPDWPVPVLKHFPRHLMVLRFECPHDDLPMLNETTPFSFKAGTYSCGEGHRWERWLGDWHGHNVWQWNELPTLEEEAEFEREQAWAAYVDAMQDAEVAIARVEGEVARVATEEAAYTVLRDEAFDAVEAAIRDARSSLVPAETAVAS